jgi:hypothetical protein
MSPTPSFVRENVIPQQPSSLICVNRRASCWQPEKYRHAPETVIPPHKLNRRQALRDVRFYPIRHRSAHFDVRSAPEAEIGGAYSISSSASDINDAGIVSPSAFAVVRLMMNSNFVGCSTGISPGFVPRRTLSTTSAARRKKSEKLGA